MHCTALLTALAALTALSTAAPTVNPAYARFTKSSLQKRDVSANDIFNSINAWINNVDNVNTFLNNANDLLAANDGSLLSAANEALANASDEPIQLQIQSSLSNLSADGQGAVAALMGIFQTGVLDQLNMIIANPTDAGIVHSAVDTINNARCNVVLPSLDILWPAAADASGASPNPPPAQRENACSS